MESLTRDDYSGEAWTCPAERMKGKLDHLVPMTAALQELIGEQPKDWRIRPYVFSTTGGKRPISGYSKAKAALDREVAALRKREGRQPMRPWTMQRDVRRPHSIGSADRAHRQFAGGQRCAAEAGSVATKVTGQR
jgi:integrase